jgi:copper oxidase (laccase) domain-containing protein
VNAMLAELEERVDAAARPWMAVRQIQETPVLEAKLPGGFRAFFTTRIGGSSSGVCSSLNLDPRSEDDPVSVAQNRRIIQEAVGRQLLSPLQAHGVRVAGAAEYLLEEPQGPCDGLTLHPEIDRGLAAALLFADCVPIVLCGEVDMAVAHGGWRGILGGIVQQAGRAMMGAPATMIIGPSLGPCCFEVGSEVAESFARRFGPDVVISDGSGGGVLRVDLWEAAARASSEIGIRREHVINPRLCTACNQEFFYSYRSEGPVTGRHACVGWMADA